MHNVHGSEHGPSGVPRPARLHRIRADDIAVVAVNSIQGGTALKWSFTFVAETRVSYNPLLPQVAGRGRNSPTNEPNPNRREGEERRQIMKKLSKRKMRFTRGGSGRDLGDPGAGAGTNAWGFGTPFNPSGNENAGLRKNFVPGDNEQSAVDVIVPVKI